MSVGSTAGRGPRTFLGLVLPMAGSLIFCQSPAHAEPAVLDNPQMVAQAVAQSAPIEPRVQELQPAPPVDPQPLGTAGAQGPTASPKSGPIPPEATHDGAAGGPASVADVLSSILPPTQSVPPRYRVLFTTASKSQPVEDQPQATSQEAIYHVPLVVNPRVDRHMRFFHTSIRDRFEKWLERLGRYRKQVEDIFTEFDLPKDLIFLSLVESGFNPHAYSRARATGPWQFMQGTAKVYGLRVDQYVDERRDPIKSTVAAAKYLRDLYDMFGAWPLAMAAYNAGEGKVMRALQKTQADSFWEIAETKLLKPETKEYVPRFMAATIIAKNPDQYGFPTAEPPPHEFDEVVVRRSVHLRDVASTIGVSFDELERLNPELRRSVTPPGEEYHLKVPTGLKARVESLLDQVKTWKGPLPSVKQAKARGEWYKVRVGDTFQSVAKRFRLSVPELKAKNNLVGHHILRPGQHLRVGP